MAITIKVEPQLLQTVYNPVITVLDSTNKTKENYQFVVDVNVDGTNQSRLKVQPNPDGYGVIDIHRHLEPYVTYDFSNPTTDLTEITTAVNSFVSYSVVLSEEYIPTLTLTDIVDNGNGTLQGTTTTAHGFNAGDSIKLLNVTPSTYDATVIVATTGSSTTFAYTGSYTIDATAGEVRLSNEPTTNFTSSTTYTGNKYVFNGVLDWRDVNGYDYSDYDLVNTTQSLLTTIDSYQDTVPGNTDWNGAYEVRPHSRMYLNMFDSVGTFNYCQIGRYDSSGNYVADRDSDANITGSKGYDNVIRMAVGPYNINNSGNVGGWGNDFLTGSSYYYTQVAASSGTSKYYKFKIVDPCSKYEDYQFLFLDRWGSFLPVHFDLLSKKTVGMEKSSYNQNIGTYNSTSNTYGYNSYDRGKTRLNTRLNETISVTSNYVTEAQSRIIEEMLASPEVYHIDEDGNTYAVDIITAGYTVKTRINDKLINHTIDFRYSYMDAQQR